MVDENHTVKIIDLGMCLVVPQVKEDVQVLVDVQMVRGKLSCMSPEIYEEQGKQPGILPFTHFSYLHMHIHLYILNLQHMHDTHIYIHGILLSYYYM